MPIINQDELALWQRIEEYDLGNYNNEDNGFEKKLQIETKWSKAYCTRLILEYKRFAFLCCVLKGGASPSQDVDIVWHLHLTYTKAYWNVFCKEILRKDLHHFPSTGKTEEIEKLYLKYLETLQAYHSYFDVIPPIDIWPDRHLNKKLEKLNSFHGYIFIAVLIGFLVFPVFWGKSWAFDLKGPDFIVYYLLLLILSIGLSFWFYKERKKGYIRLLEQYVQPKPTIYQIAYHLTSKHHAIQTGLINLIDNGRMVVTKDKSMEKDNRFLEKKDFDFQSNPFLDDIENYKTEEVISYHDVENKWFKRYKFEHVRLHYLLSLPPNRTFHFFFFFLMGIGFVRVIQGLLNNKPVEYLVIEMGCFLMFNIVFFQMTSTSESLIKEFLIGNQKNDNINLSSKYAINGRGVLASISSGFYIAQVFPRFDKNGEKSKVNCNSSGCTSSGCSGGGSSCGGGCGGCGGGD